MEVVKFKNRLVMLENVEKLNYYRRKRDLSFLFLIKIDLKYSHGQDILSSGAIRQDFCSFFHSCMLRIQIFIFK